MNYEKEYKEAFKRAERRFDPNPADGYAGYANGIIEDIFPQFIKREDERTRKEILDFIKSFWADHKESIPRISSWLTWLEKQKEQNPANSEKPKEWTEDDSIALKEIQIALSQHCTSEDHRRDLCRWLDLHCNAYPLPEKLYQQWKSSKEQNPAKTDDEKEYIRTIKGIIADFIRDKKPEDVGYYQRIYDWLEGRHIEQKPSLVQLAKEACSCGDNRFWIIDRAKKDIIEKTNIESSTDEMKVLDNILFRAWQMGWLSKYDVIVPEQKPAEWSEEDKKMFEEIMKILPADESIKRWFISHYSTQPKQEWSEEDERMLNELITIMEGGKVTSGTYLSEYVTWLKSLRPQPHWKPSKEQMTALYCAIADIARFSKRGGRQVELENEPYYSALHSLYCNLEKLM